MQKLIVIVALVVIGGCFLSRQETAEYQAIKDRLATYSSAAESILENAIAGKIKPGETVKQIDTIIQSKIRDEQRKIALEDEAAKNRRDALALGLNIIVGLAGIAVGFLPANSKASKAVSALQDVSTVIETNGTPELKTAITDVTKKTGTNGFLNVILNGLGFIKGTIKK